MSRFFYGPRPWFAWRPVRCRDGRVRWLCRVNRHPDPKSSLAWVNASYTRLEGEYEPTPEDWLMRAYLAAAILAGAADLVGRALGHEPLAIQMMRG